MLLSAEKMTPKESYKLLKKLVSGTTSKKFTDLCLVAMDNKEFQAHPASLKKHHTWAGGLIQHTYEVAFIAASTEEIVGSDKISLDILITAAIWHDFGKIYDVGYRSSEDRIPVTDDWETPEYHHLTDLSHKKMIYHVSRSYAEWMIASNGKLSEDERNEVGHCILAHHGRKEWSTVKEPRTAEAYALHHADMTSVFILHDTFGTHE